MKKILKIVLLLSIVHLALSRVRSSYLKCGESLIVNEYLVSSNDYYAVLQSDCNFVIYASRHFVARNAIWQTKTNRSDCKNPKLVNQKDGNVVIYSDNKSIWSTKTSKPGNVCYEFVMQDDGNLVLYDKNKSVWSSKSSA